MKVLLAGVFRYEHYQPAMAKALRSLGWTVGEFSWFDYVNRRSLYWRIQHKLMMGPSIKCINEALIEKCRSSKPDVAFIDLGIYIYPKTIKKIKDFVGLVVSYNVDDPFGNYGMSRLWRYFIPSIPLYDINFVYRQKSIQEYIDMGAPEVHLMRSYYVPYLHRPIELSNDEQKMFGSDLVFIGHCEPDLRIECIEALLQDNINIKVYGTSWDRYLPHNLKSKLGPINPIYGDDYVKVLCASKIALCFFSKLNNSKYTRRCFEIPACGALLMSERTDTLRELYEEDEEAVYFSDSNELVGKVQELLGKPDKRNSIAAAGHNRCISDGHDVVSRMRDWTNIISQRLCNNGQNQTEDIC